MPLVHFDAKPSARGKKMRRLANINCLEVTADDPSNNQDLLILFHGYGADAYDLQTLSEALHPPRPTDFLFPQGPLEVPIGPGWTGRAWWNINMAALQEANAKNSARELGNEYPEGLKKIRPQILKMIKEARIPWNKVILGGFSQGAMLATDIFLNAPETPKGLIIFSGALVSQDEWKPLIANRKGSQFFQSHGQGDAVLSFRNAQQLETLLTQGGMKGKLIPFSGGHEIPLQIIQKADQYLKQI